MFVYHWSTFATAEVVIKCRQINIIPKSIQQFKKSHRDTKLQNKLVKLMKFGAVIRYKEVCSFKLLFQGKWQTTESYKLSLFCPSSHMPHRSSFQKLHSLFVSYMSISPKNPKFSRYTTASSKIHCHLRLESKRLKYLEPRTIDLNRFSVNNIIFKSNV